MANGLGIKKKISPDQSGEVKSQDHSGHEQIKMLDMFHFPFPLYHQRI